MSNFKDIEVNKHHLKIIFDVENEHWYILFPKYGQYISGSFNDNGMERVHHPIVIGRTRQYELVLDPNDSLTNWESFSIFDCKKQCYIETAQGSI